MKTYNNFLNEDLQHNIEKRIDYVLDYSNEHDIKVSDEAFETYIEFLNENYEKIEKMINKINNDGYVWSVDMPMFYTTTMSELGNDNMNDELKIYKQKAEIHYKYTSVWKNLILDNYHIIFKNDNINVNDILNSNELFELLKNGAIFTETGNIGLTAEAVKELIKKM